MDMECARNYQTVCKYAPTCVIQRKRICVYLDFIVDETLQIYDAVEPFKSDKRRAALEELIE